VPRGVPHTFRVVGDGPARVLGIGLPGVIESLFREIGRPAEGPGLPPSAAVDVAAVAAAAARAGTTFIGPPLA
jgi:hypothetical protein